MVIVGHKATPLFPTFKQHKQQIRKNLHTLKKHV